MYAVIGLLLIAFTGAAGFFVEKRQFERRNSAGVEEFTSYSKMVRMRAEEGLMKALGTLSAFVGMGFLVYQSM